MALSTGLCALRALTWVRERHTLPLSGFSEWDLQQLPAKLRR